MKTITLQDAQKQCGWECLETIKRQRKQSVEGKYIRWEYA